MKQPQLNYDQKARILSIRLSLAKSVDSDIRGNIVFDYDAAGELTNIDIMQINLTNFLPHFNRSLVRRSSARRNLQRERATV